MKIPTNRPDISFETGKGYFIRGRRYGLLSNFIDLPGDKAKVIRSINGLGFDICVNRYGKVTRTGDIKKPKQNEIKFHFCVDCNLKENKTEVYPMECSWSMSWWEIDGVLKPEFIKRKTFSDLFLGIEKHAAMASLPPFFFLIGWFIYRGMK